MGGYLKYECEIEHFPMCVIILKYLFLLSEKGITIYIHTCIILYLLIWFYALSNKVILLLIKIKHFQYLVPILMIPTSTHSVSEILDILTIVQGLFNVASKIIWNNLRRTLIFRRNFTTWCNKYIWTLL